LRTADSVKTLFGTMGLPNQYMLITDETAHSFHSWNRNGSISSTKKQDKMDSLRL